MTTYKTKVTNIYTVNTPDPDYVVNVLFTVNGVDGDYTASIDGNVQFSQEASQSEFIPYSDLTEQIILGWINSATNDQANYYSNIDGQIESQKNPPVSPKDTVLPWVADLNAKTFTIE